MVYKEALKGLKLDKRSLSKLLLSLVTCKQC